MARHDRATQERMGRGFEILWKQVSALARHSVFSVASGWPGLAGP
jgi:hypothetical protein